MTWLVITISAYFILAVVSLIDKYILTGSIPNPKIYAFYSGVLGLALLLIIPFVGFYIPSAFQVTLSLLTGILSIFSLFLLYRAISLFEPSRIIPVIGSLNALFTFLLVYFFSSGKETLGYREIAAFLLLLSSSFLITYEKEKKISFQSLKFSIPAALVFALCLVLTKYVYLGQEFWNGLIWMRIGGFIMVLCLLLFSGDVREEILKKKKFIPARPGLLLFDQGLGAGANLLLNFAVFLSPLAYLSIMNALVGVQYAFLLVLAVVISLKFPQFLKEKITKGILFQKIIAILLIGGGLYLLAV